MTGTESEESWSTVLPETWTKESTSIRRCYDPYHSPTLGMNGCQTLYEALRRGQELNPMGPCLGFRAISSTGQATPYIYSCYNEVVARVDAFSAGLQAMDLLDKNEEGLLLLGIYMKNCAEWIISEQGIYNLGGATVPFYDTLGPDTVSFILNQTNLTACVCSRAELPSLCQAKLTNKCPKFRAVILIDGITPKAVQLCKQAGIHTCTYFAKIETHGANLISSTQHYPDHHRPTNTNTNTNKQNNNLDILKPKHSPPSPNDIATFCYTSGTTGNPKGALLTHSNLISAIAGIHIFFQPDITHRHLSYLPLPHIFERTVLNSILAAGASVAFYQGDTTKLIEDMQACRPTILPAAPRVLNKIHDKIQTGMLNAGGLKLKLFQHALTVKTQNLKHGMLHHPIYDKLIFNKIKHALGMDCLQFVISGSAPLAENVMTFFRCMLGVPVVEGYGQTEGSAAATMSHKHDISTVGHVGGPVGCVEIKLVNVPEMGYLGTDTLHQGKPCQGRGEICVRGPAVFKGYYKEEEKTKETVDEDGWLHSGDIGLWNMQGALQIIDRKKNIFKLAQGEYVAAEKIENILSQSLFIGQCFVYGDSFQSSLVAIIVPDEDVVSKWSQDVAKIPQSSIKEICNSKLLNDHIMNEIKTLAKKNGLHGFETPKAIFLEPSPFSPDNDLITPTFKLKRPQLKQFYHKQIDEMYAAMPPPASKL